MSIQHSLMPNSDSTKNFNRLPRLPVRMVATQCIYFENEILICGGLHQNNCYSYHIPKQKYKLICSYPNDVLLCGHAVIPIEIKKINNNNMITLLSFGGTQSYDIPYHTKIMNYQSIWTEINKQNSFTYISTNNTT